MNSVPFFEIGLYHFLIVSFLLLAAGIATMLTKRNAIGILIGVELVLNAASINFVAFNHYGWPGHSEEAVATAASMPMALAAPASQPSAMAPSTQPEAAAASAATPAEAPGTQPATAGVDLAAPAPAADSDNDRPRLIDPDAAPLPGPVWHAAIDGQMFSIFIIVLAAAEAAVALAIFLNFYNNFSSIDVERGDELKG